MDGEQKTEQQVVEEAYFDFLESPAARDLQQWADGRFERITQELLSHTLNFEGTQYRRGIVTGIELVLEYLNSFQKPTEEEQSPKLQVKVTPFGDIHDVSGNR